nr:hypothetical protein A4A49_08815 [Ipomoea trifida]GMC53551.1 hypothetical protein A4A49_08815 [Ipomoea batatas]
MDAEAWCDLTAGDDNVCWRRCPSVREYDRIDDGRWPARRSADANSKGRRLWRLVWRKIKKEKRRMFECSNSTRFTYDPYSYSQNFDQGSFPADSDELSRSFSARFAMPSRIFPKSELMV